MYIMFSESHCHLGSITADKIDEAKKNGFTLLLTSGIDLKSSIEAADTASRYDIVKGSVGVHPWYADEYNDDVGKRFREIAKNPEVVAISEIGLDYIGRMTKEWVREEEYIDKDIQMETLSKQLKLARDLEYPAIVHDRSEGMDLLELLLDTRNTESGLAIHGFSKDAEYAEKAFENGIYLSVGLRTLQNGDQNFLEAISITPIEYLLTETDSGDPHGVLEVCSRIAKIKDLTRDEVGRITTENLMKLCKIS